MRKLSDKAFKEWARRSGFDKLRVDRHGRTYRPDANGKLVHVQGTPYKPTRPWIDVPLA